MSEPLYFKQLEIGPMQNYVYLFGDPETREAAVVDAAWDIDAIVDVAERGRLPHHEEPRHALPPRPSRRRPHGPLRSRAPPSSPARPASRRTSTRTRCRSSTASAGSPTPTSSASRAATRPTSAASASTFLHTPGHTPGSQCFLVGNTLHLGRHALHRLVRPRRPARARTRRTCTAASPRCSRRCPTRRSSSPATTTPTGRARRSATNDVRRHNDRQQLRWLVWMAGLTGVFLILVPVTGIGQGPDESRPLNSIAFFGFPPVCRSRDPSGVRDRDLEVPPVRPRHRRQANGGVHDRGVVITVLYVAALALASGQHLRRARRRGGVRPDVQSGPAACTLDRRPRRLRETGHAVRGALGVLRTTR